jgi:Glycosyltransferase like family 2
MFLSESPGTIALPTAEIGRFTMFMLSLSGTRQPEGTNLGVRASGNVTENLNSAIRDLRDEDDWLWILGDDHVWEPDCLTKLLDIIDSTPEADILVPLVVKRNPPWHLVIFHAAGLHDDGMPLWKPYEWKEVPPVGVFEVDAAGSAGMLVRREVLDDIGDPWFESSDGIVLNEDVMFCARARKHGFRIFATADVTMGHLGVFNVRPLYKDGRWGALAEFSSPEEQFRHLFMPDIEEPHKETVSGH